MILALLGGGVGVVLLLALIWLVLGGVRAILEEEAIGQIRRAARALVRASARRMPEGERMIVVQRLLDDLERKELAERPLSQFLVALSRWMRSLEMRRAPRRVLGLSRTFALRASAWVVGADPRVVRLVPHEHAALIACGGTVVVGSVMTGGAIALALHDWSFVPPAIAAICGAGCGLTSIALDRFCLSMRPEASRWSSAARMVAAGVAQLLLAWIVATALSLRVLRPEILALAERGGHHAGDVGFYEAMAALQRLAESHPELQVMGIMFTVLVLTLLASPLLWRLRPSILPRLVLPGAGPDRSA